MQETKDLGVYILRVVTLRQQKYLSLDWRWIMDECTWALDAKSLTDITELPVFWP